MSYARLLTLFGLLCILLSTATSHLYISEINTQLERYSHNILLKDERIDTIWSLKSIIESRQGLSIVLMAITRHNAAQHHERDIEFAKMVDQYLMDTAHLVRMNSQSPSFSFEEFYNRVAEYESEAEQRIKEAHKMKMNLEADKEKLRQKRQNYQDFAFALQLLGFVLIIWPLTSRQYTKC